ncbi:MAG: YggU family protein [Bdellovibrio sp. CG10_big_fil_rev_8_21_14_0_10_47_8]|nr:MAG: YggU family protein [Bdellovibrio sp. CG10_big_fil_rev_8_21_14_0_10_47_8]
MFRETPEGVQISLYVQPNAPRSMIIGEHNGALKIKIKAPPVEGKANEEIVRFFAELLDLPKSKVEMLRGEKSRGKTVLIHGLSLESVRAVVFEG